MTIYINPGSGPVAGATLANAEANMSVLIEDLKKRPEITTIAMATPQQPTEDEGRYAFVIVVNGEDHEVEMPGLPLNQVRYMRENNQNIWDFPRLYVDGSSWVWFFALNMFEEDE